MVALTTALVMLPSVEFEDMACLSRLWDSRADYHFGEQPLKTRWQPPPFSLFSYNSSSEIPQIYMACIITTQSFNLEEHRAGAENWCVMYLLLLLLLLL
jgi:hypothetical protein